MGRSFCSSCGLAYGAALSAFRGGPTFPGMFIGAAGGIALSHLPGLPMIAGAAMGMGAMLVVMLGLTADVGPAYGHIPSRVMPSR